MNFFKSVFSDEPDDDPTHKPESESPKQHDPDEQPNSSSSQETNDNGNRAWSFGGLIKTLATKSESVIEIYSRDLKEFGSGLKKEIEVAQGSLENVGHVIDEFGNTVVKGTTQIISQGKDAILAADLESDSSDNSNSKDGLNSVYSNLQRKYSRFDAQLRVIQSDVSTYCEDPYDLDDYGKWKSGFVLDEKKGEIENLLDDNADVGGMYQKFVPSSVDHETFWSRYFYKVYKLKQAEDMRARLVKRAISREEEELSWDVDDSDSNEGEGEESSVGAKVKSMEVSGGDAVEEGSKVEKLDVGNAKDGGKEEAKSSHVAQKDDGNEIDVAQSKKIGEKETEGIGEKENCDGKSLVENKEVVHGEDAKRSDADIVVKERVAESSTARVPEEKMLERGDSGTEKKEIVPEFDEKVSSEGKADDEEHRKNSDFSVVSSQPSQPDEEDLGWDEIEDLSSIDDKKATNVSSPKIAELRKRLSAAEEEEDLSWDIEDDDDEPIKG